MYVQKWYLPYKTSDISETKQSKAKVTTTSIETRVRPIDWGDIGRILAYFSGEQNF